MVGEMYFIQQMGVLIKFYKLGRLNITAQHINKLSRTLINNQGLQM
jgi:hypothetical protein